MNPSLAEFTVNTQRMSSKVSEKYEVSIPKISIPECNGGKRMVLNKIKVIEIANWKISFCTALKPLFSFFLSFAISSITPTKQFKRAKARHNAIVNPEVDFSFINSEVTNTVLTTTTAKLKAIPPIVGVPCLLMCHFGPDSYIGCFAVFLRSGIRICSVETVITKVKRKGIKRNGAVILFYLLYF